MNLLQMLCCSLIVRGGELGQQYLISKSESIQSTLRARRVQTAVEAGRFLDSLVQELTLSGKDVCKCEDATPSPEPATRILNDNGASWRSRNN
jgi:hypothetical protein